MLVPLVFGLTTALLGGISLIFFEAWHNASYRYLSDISPVLWLGDTVILSVYNGLTITAVLITSFPPLAYIMAGTGSLLGAFFYQFLEERFRIQTRVTPTELYHIVFILLESFYIVLTLFTDAATLIPVLLLLSYATTLIYSLLAHNV